MDNSAFKSVMTLSYPNFVFIALYIIVYGCIYRFTPAPRLVNNVVTNTVDIELTDILNGFGSTAAESSNSNTLSRFEHYRQRRERRPPRFRTSHVFFEGLEKHSEQTRNQITELYYSFLLHAHDLRCGTAKSTMNKYKREIIYRYGREYYDPRIVTDFKRSSRKVFEQDHDQYNLIKNRNNETNFQQKIPSLQQIIRSKIKVYGTQIMKANLNIIDEHIRYINET